MEEGFTAKTQRERRKRRSGRGIAPLRREGGEGREGVEEGFTAKTRRGRRKRRSGRGIHREDAKGAKEEKEEKEWKRDSPRRRKGREGGEGGEGRQGARVSGRLWILRGFAVGIGTIE